MVAMLIKAKRATRWLFEGRHWFLNLLIALQVVFAIARVVHSIMKLYR